MPRFKASYLEDGLELSTYITAANKKNVADILYRDGIEVIRIDYVSSADGVNILTISRLKSIFTPRLKPRERSMLLRRMATLVKTKQRLIPAFASLGTSMSGATKRVVLDLKQHLEEGRTLIEGLEALPNDIPPTVMAIIKSSSSTSGLYEGLTEFFKVVVRFSRFMLLPEPARFLDLDSDLLAL